MKLIIVLILLIGAAVSQTALTGSTSNLWELMSSSPTTGTAYNLILRYGINAASGATTTVATSGQDIGVVCIATTSNFTLAAGAVAQVGWSMQSTATGTATIAASANWGDILVYSLSAITHTSDTSLLTGATGTACTKSISLGTTISDQKAWWFFDITATCANLPAYGAVDWYGRCFHKVAAIDKANESGKTLVVSGAKNVTIGASTFATGATILAGIAYLQF
jgi:hypothetical protein